MAQTTPVVAVELVRPQTDDLGHYMAFPGPGTYHVMGVVASSGPLTSVEVNGVTATLFQVNYVPFNMSEGMGTTGFRASVFANGISPIGIVVTDQAGNVGSAAYLPDSVTALQRLQFWKVWRPNDPFVDLRLANANAWIGDLNTALGQYASFIASQPDYMLARQLRGLAYLDAGNAAAARDDLAFIVNAVPDGVPARMDLAAALTTLGDTAGAADQYQQVLQLRPDVAEAHMLLGQVWMSQGSLVEASFQEQAALQDQPTMPDAYYQLGLINAQQGNYGQALYSMQRSIAFNPRNGATFLALAQLRYQRGEYDRAWQAVHRAQQWGAQPDPTFLDALNARMREPRDVAPRFGVGHPGP